MFGVLFKLGFLRVCTLVLMMIVLPCCTDMEYMPYFLPTLGIIVALWFLYLETTADHFYVETKFVYNFTRWLTGLITFVFIAKLSVIQSVPDENTEILTFVNLQNIYTCLWSEIIFFQKLVIFILRALYRMFGLLKPFLYIVYLIINSVVLLYLIEIFITRLHLVIQKGMILTESDFEIVSGPEAIYNRKTSLDISTSDKYQHSTKFPIEPCHTGAFREDHIRYTGEDVRIQCGFFIKSYKRNKRLKSFASYWLKDGQVFITHNDDRIEEMTQVDALEDASWVQMSLTIKFLQSRDFGLYQCICDYTYVISELHTIPIITTNNTVKYRLIHFETEAYKVCYFGKHFVLRNADLVEYVKVPVGNLAHIRKFSYITHAPVDEISFEYNVNGKDVHSICRPEYWSCTLPVIVFGYWKYGRAREDILQWQPMQDGSYIDLQTCVCGSFYGEHSLTMYIPYFNSTTKREEIVEIQHEKRLIVEPVILWWGENSTQYKKMSLDPTAEKSKVNEYVIELICSSQDLNLFALNVIEYCIAFGLSWVLIRLFSYPWRTYCRLTVIPVRNLIFYGYLFSPQKCLKGGKDNLAEIEHKEAIHYDIYLSYSVEDYEWCRDILLPYLENGCGYIVCFPERDFVHEAGMSKLALYSKATQASKRFVVVLSQGYIDDPECNKLQLSTCILPLINEDNEDKRTVIFIQRSHGITLPVQLKWNMVVNIVDWTQGSSEQDAKLKLKRFLTHKGMY